ncbi:Uncharacterised protein [Kocuria rosea]|uniref:hypothetical protein n=1 Tax=Kocuria rosea TaxID=1275 RepID=UPI000E003F81|nr:hypothetical protein [Kocuria rosea]STX01736.1 Uncharacterised protein [Kocuria rosea]
MTRTGTGEFRPTPGTGSIDVVAEAPVCAGDLDPSTAAGSRRRVMATGLVVEVTVSPVTGAQNYTALLAPDCPQAPGDEGVTAPGRCASCGTASAPCRASPRGRGCAAWAW